MPAKLLIVDDEPDIVQMLREYFELNGYAVVTAADGDEALSKLDERVALILLDVGLPQWDGLELCKRIRQFVSCPILFLTARVEDNDKIAGFRVGGDDYITKPFSLDELGARVEAHLRREQRRTYGGRPRFEEDLVIDFAEKAVYHDGVPVALARREFEIVEFLSTNAGQVFDKERIYERVWGVDGEGDSAVVAEHIRRIRCKLSAAGCKNHIETVWGVGYKWVR